MLENVARDEAVSTVRQVDEEAGGAVGPVGQQIGEDLIGLGAALDKMSDLRVVGMATGKREASDLADVEVVRVSIARAIMIEFRVLYDDVAGRVRTGEDAVLIIMEMAVSH